MGMKTNPLSANPQARPSPDITQCGLVSLTSNRPQSSRSLPAACITFVTIRSYRKRFLLLIQGMPATGNTLRQYSMTNLELKVHSVKTGGNADGSSVYSPDKHVLPSGTEPRTADITRGQGKANLPVLGSRGYNLVKAMPACVPGGR